MLLSQWLERLERLHPSKIALGLERVRRVAEKLPLDFSGGKIITVAGTNGKGSTICLMSSILRAAGFKVGCYTSPHLLRYNERVELKGRLASDQDLSLAFAHVEQAREEEPLTYFEFGTLAALWLFSRQDLDFILLEVGLGGRLDAVNMVDSNLAVLTNVALDHTDWLGETREEIAFEKAGVMRPGRPVVYGEGDVPKAVLNRVRELKAKLWAKDRDYGWRQDGAGGWRWHGRDGAGRELALDNLPLAGFPLDNCAAAVQAVSLLQENIERRHIVAGLRQASLPGRFQIIDRGHALVLDVAHNPHAAAWLVDAMKRRFPGRQVHIVLAMLGDKDWQTALRLLKALKPKWYVCEIADDRGLTAKMLYNQLLELGEAPSPCSASIASAFLAAEQAADKDDVVLATGSFRTVGTVLELIEKQR